MAKPKKFDSTKRDKSNKFEIACRMYLHANHPNITPAQRVMFITSYPEGGAKSWLEPFMEQDLIRGVPVNWLQDNDLFWMEFRARYGIVNRDENNRAKLESLKQTGTVQEFLGLFQTYSSTLGYNDTVLRDMFYDGLKDEIQGDMMSQNFNPTRRTTFGALAQQALDI